MRTSLQILMSVLAWPALFILSILGTAYGFAQGHAFVTFNIVYFCLIFTLFALEQIIPHEKKWNDNDGQTWPNIAHTLTSKGTVQGLLIFGGIIGITEVIRPMDVPGYGIWPRDWPFAAQVILGLITTEFGLYWAHRLSHEWYPLWRFHAVHHSVTRLWVVNTGRFHFMDSVLSIALGLAVTLALGAPLEVITFVSFITAYIGLLTHCNVDMRDRVWSYVFNTPGLHRWHHSRDDWEGNKNYGENLMIWDQIFRTWFLPRRRPPVDIGITEDMPKTYVKQLLWPFAGMRLKSPKNGKFWIIHSHKPQNP